MIIELSKKRKKRKADSDQPAWGRRPNGPRGWSPGPKLAGPVRLSSVVQPHEIFELKSNFKKKINQIAFRLLIPRY
jgi:hypothetical protein